MFVTSLCLFPFSSKFLRLRLFPMASSAPARVWPSFLPPNRRQLVLSCLQPLGTTTCWAAALSSPSPAQRISGTGRRPSGRSFPQAKRTVWWPHRCGHTSLPLRLRKLVFRRRARTRARQIPACLFPVLQLYCQPSFIFNQRCALAGVLFPVLYCHACAV